MELGNLHPIAVHFPVAFITVYCLFEILRFKLFTSQPYWFYLKAVTLFIGFAGMLAALATGLYITWGSKLDPVTNMHQTLAFITTVLFAIISLAYKAEWVKRSKDLLAMTAKFSSLWKLMLLIHSLIFKPPTLIMLAIVGLLSITVQGALGGIIVRGSQTDPVAYFIYNLLFKQ